MAYYKNKISGFLRFLLLVLFVSYYSSITLFYHTHLVNGEVIVHSHPFSKKNQKPFQSHSHSSSTYIHIQHLMYAVWESSPETPQITEPVISFCEYKVGYTLPFIHSSSYTYAQLRAPPIG